MTSARLFVSAFGLSTILGACTQPDDSPVFSSSPSLDVELEQSERIGTVVTLAFDTVGADQAWVELSRDGFVERSIPVTIGDDGLVEVPVLGMKPGTTYSLQAFASHGDNVVSSLAVEHTTGDLPSGMPRIDIQDIDPQANAGGFLVTSFLAPPRAVILDRDGDYVWWYSPDEIDTLSRAVLSKDGRSMLMGAGNVQGDEGTDIIRVSLDGSQVDTIDTPDRHHDFLERDDGTIAYIAYDPRFINGHEVAGDQIVEVDPDGTRRQVFSIWDHHNPTPDDLSAGFNNSVADWPHANAMELADGGDSYMISYLQMDAIAKVDRESGEELWMLGGDESTITRPDGSTDFFDGQHGMDWDGDQLLIFSNQLGTARSEAVELAFKHDAGHAEEVWNYQPNPALQTIIMGDVSRLDAGNTIVTFSYNGQIHEVDAQGEPVWILSTGIGGAVGYTTWKADL